MPLGSYTSAAFTTATGVAVAATADVEVRRESDSALASIFSDRAGSSAISQPGFQADSEGRFVFYAAGIAGGYQVKVTKGAETYTARYQATGTAQELDANPFWAGPLATATEQTAREALGIMGASAAAKIPVGDDTDFRAIAALGGFALLNGHLDWTVAGSVLTIAVKTAAGADPSATDPVYFGVRDETASDGSLTWVPLTAALSLSINDTALLGTINSTPFKLWCVGFLDGATPRLAVINCLAGTAPGFSIYPLGAWGIASAVLEDNASDSAHVFYAGAAVADKAYAVLGNARWESGLAAAGTWSAGPTRKQMFGPGVRLPGDRVQQVREQTGALATGATVLPSDDTQPLAADGNEFMDLSITPTSAANLMEVSHTGYYASSDPTQSGIGAFFTKDAGDAIAVGRFGRTPAAHHAFDGSLVHQELAADASARTYNLRVGSGSAGTITFNGSTGARLFGGFMASYLSATEIET